MTPPKYSTAIVDLPRSGIRRIYDQASQYPDCIRLEVGEPGFGTPAHIKAAAERAMAEGFTRYTPNAGIRDLREALVTKLHTRNGILADPDDVIVTSGAVASVFSTLASLVDPGDEVLVSDPSWPNYVQMALLLGAVPVHYPLRLEHDLVPTVDDIERSITPASKVLIVNSPGNPSGAVTPEHRLRDILELAREHDLWVISDEVYDEIYFDAPPPSMFPLDTDGRVVSVFSFSKTYAMTGWRVGYLVGAPELVGHVLRAQEPITSCVNSIAQMAAVEAIRGDQTCVAEMRASYAANAVASCALLDDAGVPYSRPSGAFYLMVDISGSGLSDIDFCSRMIEERRVAVVPGSAFGPASGRYARVSLASPLDDLRVGLERVADAVVTWSPSAR
ncbi:MAG TPA: pyridoxal phosphate-dependent aminotransferase [Ilumatobacteraceae bacterium]|nr:pyridoxal phosphate-dependent aminotransferase [Ilumatobacteraceae bacterium]